MDIRFYRRVRACLVLFILLSLNIDGARGALLLSYDFEDAAMEFELVPEFADPAISAAMWSDDFGLLTEFAGNPGRALATSGFTNGNSFHLDLSFQSGLAITIESIRFDLRASPSGPTSWQVLANGTSLASGAVTTAFETVDAAVTLASTSARLIIDLEADGATSSAGTLRLDNVVVTGSVSVIPLPPGFYLFATPLVGLALNRIGERYRQRRSSAPAQAS